MAKKHRRPVPDMRHDFDGIMAKVRANVILTESGCWEWQKHRNALGYGTICWDRRVWTLTRLVYTANHGAFDPDLDICHTCDNPSCCNPQHLWAGEHRDNLKDGGRKGRLQGQWKTHCVRNHPLSGDNLYLCSKGLRHCNACQLGRLRIAKGGWPEHLAYTIGKVPHGYTVDFQTGEIISTKGRARRAA